MKEIYNFYRKTLPMVVVIFLFCAALQAQSNQHYSFNATITGPPCNHSSFSPANDVNHAVEITVKGTYSSGIFVGVPSPGIPDATKTFRFLTYNLGAKPTMTPKQQMAYFPVCPEDITVYGGFYQWGRKDVRHTFRCDAIPDVANDSRFSDIPLLSVSEENGKFIYGMTSPYDWLASHYLNNTLWGDGTLNGTNSGSNNPCPSGYRVPTEHEWALLSWEGGTATNTTGDYSPTISVAVTLAPSGLYWVKVVNGLVVNTSFSAANSMCGFALYEKSVWEGNQIAVGGSLIDASAPTPLLFLPAAGHRYHNNGALNRVGTDGYYWSSSPYSTTNAHYLDFSSTSVDASSNPCRAYGYSVRCIEDCPDAVIDNTTGYIPSTRQAALACKLNCGDIPSVQLKVMPNGNATDFTYQWYSGAPGSGAAILDSTAQTCTVTATGTYYCVVTTGICSGNSITSLPFTVTKPPCVAPVCAGNAFTPTVGGNVVEIKVKVDYAGNGVTIPTSPTNTTKKFRFLTYNLGANSTMTPKQQMAHFPVCQEDMTVYGGFYQWGRKDAAHTFRCDTATSNTNYFLQTLIPTSSLPTDHGKFIWGANLASNSNNWATPHVAASALWGNGGSLATQKNTIYTPGVHNTNNPCPEGWRVPTQHEWALLGKEDGNSLNEGSDQFSPNDYQLAPSGLYWVQVVNGFVSSNWCSATCAMTGYALYDSLEWASALQRDPRYGTGQLSLCDPGDPNTPTPLMFLPAAGQRNTAGVFGSNAGIVGQYWSSTVGTGSQSQDLSISMSLSANSVQAGVSNDRAMGRSVRCMTDCLDPDADVIGYDPSTKSATIACASPKLGVTPNGALSNFTYQWYHNSNEILEGDTFPTIYVKEIGDYYCVVTPKTGCGAAYTSDKFIVDGINLPPLPVFMKYNLGADPDLNTPALQMAYMANDANGTSVSTTSHGRVFGGRYQWGRQDLPYAIDSITYLLYSGAGTANHDIAWASSMIPDANGQLPGQDDYHVHHLSVPPFDWSIPQNHSLWGNGKEINLETPGSGVLHTDGKYYQDPTFVMPQNNPCPPGFRLPTQDDWELICDYDCNPKIASGDFSVSTSGSSNGIYQTTSGLTWVRVSCSGGVCNISTVTWNLFDRGGYAVYKTSEWDAAGYTTSTDLILASTQPILFLPTAGDRYDGHGNVGGVGKDGCYWSSSINATYAYYLDFNSTIVDPTNRNTRAMGHSIRCVKEVCNIEDAEVDTYTPSTRAATVTCQNPATLSITITGNPADYTYQWYDGTDYAIPHETTPTLITYQAGDFYCMITTKCHNGASVKSKIFMVTGVSRPPLPEFLEYNLGADPSLNTPALQMIYMANDANGILTTTSHGRVFGGRYQWGRQKLPYAIDPYTYLLYDGSANHVVTWTSTMIPDGNGQLPSGQDDYHVCGTPATNGDWSVPPNNDLWGNGKAINVETSGSGVLHTDGKYYQNPVKTLNDPCPSGFRIPTQNDWELMGNYDCNPTIGVGSFIVPTSGIYQVTNGLTWVRIHCSGGVCNSTATWTASDRGGYAVYNTKAWDAAGYNTGTDLITASTQPILFIPAAGIRYCNLVGGEGIDGAYWSSSINGTYVRSMMFEDKDVHTAAYGSRDHGFSIRCVKCAIGEPCYVAP